MKIKAACIGTPESVSDAFSSTGFAQRVLTIVVGNALGVKDVLERPAEYYVQTADIGPSPTEGKMGVEVRLTGASRSGRSAKQFHIALQELVRVVSETVAMTLDAGVSCQVYCVIMIDGEIENRPGSSKYSNTLESEAVWIQGTEGRC